MQVELSNKHLETLDWLLGKVQGERLDGPACRRICGRHENTWVLREWRKERGLNPGLCPHLGGLRE